MRRVITFALSLALMLTMASPALGVGEAPTSFGVVTRGDVPHANDHVLVKLKPGVSTQALGPSTEVVFDRWQRVPVPFGRTPLEVLQQMDGRPDVEVAELDYMVQLDPPISTALNPSAEVAVNDPYTSYQWHFPAIQVADAWADSTGENVVVAVVDTGISKDGEDLNCQTFVAPYDAIDQVQGEAAARDDHGHGTHVAGTIAQCTNNGVGVAGVAFDASLMPVKVLDSTGSGLTSWIAGGIDWARTHGADVINMSLGCQGCISVAIDDAIEAAISEGIVVVAASGNDGANSVSYPASLPDVIAVGATGYTNQLAPYSNRGAALDVVAPGGNLNQDANGDGYPDGVLQETCNIDLPSCSSGWGYYYLQGTSMATPHVSGAAALLKSIAPGLNGTGIEAILEATALDLGPPGFDTSYGNGLIQLHDAISYLESPDTSPPLWPGGGQLSADLVSKNAVELQWPQASDDKVVIGYRIYQDGKLVETTAAGQTSVQISGLGSLTTYEFGVRAEDLAGNLSSALVAQKTMPDSAPPVWPSNSTLSVGKYGERQLTFSWPAAVDDTAVVGYALRLAGSTGLLTPDQTSTITGLQPGHSYLFEVLARDAAGNWSDVLTAPVRTARVFLDTPGTTFYDDILWMSGMDITRGCNPPTNDLFCPDDPVTRAQMAAFVVRALGLKLNYHPGFEDVSSGSTFAEDIGRVATAGITRGCNPPTNDEFCPDDPVTRAQMAAFLVRALGLTPNTNPGFIDVPASNIFAEDIGRLATAGITQGCNPPLNDRFCPDGLVTRGQLAAFLHRALGVGRP